MCKKREGCYPLGKIFGQNQIPMEKEDTPHVRIFVEGNCSYVNRALKEINAFEWEGDYRAEAKNRLKELLEEKMGAELEQYLGRANMSGARRGIGKIIGNGSYFRHLLTEIGDLILRIPRSRKRFVSRY